MAVEWAGLGPELLMHLDRDRPDPLRAQLEGGIREAIRSGRLLAGERLPSSRELARQLGVSRGLVQECYGQLYAEGYLSTRGGSSTRVAEIHALPTPAPEPAAPFVKSVEIDFAAGTPDLASFPRADWLWAQREACRAIPHAALGYGDPRGIESARQVIAGYLRRVRAAAADPEHLVICTGFAQGLLLTLRALHRAGVRKVAMEDPGYDRGGTLGSITHLGLQPVPIPVDHDGIDVAALAATDVGAVVLTPAHQWPTGVVLAPQRRHELIRWAKENHAYLIEDDYDAEFRYDREPVGALQGLAPETTIAIGTASKSLAPAVRFGWVLCPPQLTEQITEEKRFEDRGNPTLDQLTIAALIESGRYDRHLRRMRGLYALRREALVEALAPARLTGLAAGFHAVLHLPDSADEQEIIATARARSVGLYGMSTHRFDGSTTPPQLLLGFGNLGERTIQRGIAAIADLLR